MDLIEPKSKLKKVKLSPFCIFLSFLTVSIIFSPVIIYADSFGIYTGLGDQLWVQSLFVSRHFTRTDLLENNPFFKARYRSSSRQHVKPPEPSNVRWSFAYTFVKETVTDINTGFLVKDLSHTGRFGIGWAASDLWDFGIGLSLGTTPRRALRNGAFDFSIGYLVRFPEYWGDPPPDPDVELSRRERRIKEAARKRRSRRGRQYGEDEWGRRGHREHVEGFLPSVDKGKRLRGVAPATDVASLFFQLNFSVTKQERILTSAVTSSSTGSSTSPGNLSIGYQSIGGSIFYSPMPTMSFGLNYTGYNYWQDVREFAAGIEDIGLSYFNSVLQSFPKYSFGLSYFLVLSNRMTSNLGFNYSVTKVESVVTKTISPGLAYYFTPKINLGVGVDYQFSSGFSLLVGNVSLVYQI